MLENVVDAFWQALLGEGLDAWAFGGVGVAAIGSATADALVRRGIHADVIPEEYVSEALAESLRGRIGSGDGVLHLCAEEGRPLLAEGKIDAIAFTSSSTVRNLVKLLEGNAALLKGPAIACIGPITAATARELGLEVQVEAQVHTIPGLVEALKGWFAADNGNKG